MVNVICMKWGTRYDARYVNVLREMVKRQLSIPHRFACFTDDLSGIRDDVETFPLPSLDLPDGIPERCWRKLSTFDRTLGDLTGTTLFLDLDVVVIDRLEPFFEIDGPFRISHDWRWYGQLPVTGNSSCYRFEIGKHSEVIDDFRAQADRIRRQYRCDQDYLSAKMNKLGRLKYWPSNWCCSFKSHCLPRFPLRYFQVPRPPVGARVVIFHGLPNPPDAIADGFLSLRKCWRGSPWIDQHWREAV